MAEEKDQQIWVAVRIERGFPVEAKGYHNRELAEEQEFLWRKTMNPDYDETEVLPLIIDIS